MGRINFNKVMTHAVTAFAATLMAAMLMAGWSRAVAGSESTDAAAKADTAAAVHRVYLSAQLAAEAREQHDPVLMVAALRLLERAGGTSVPMTPEITGGEPDASGPSPAKIEHTPEPLRAEARALASGNAKVLAIIDEPLPRGLRGAGGGPKFHRQIIARGAHAKFKADFRGQEPAEVTIVGSHTADLNLIILDEHNNIVCQGVTPYDFEFCRWLPPQNASFWLVVENRGNWTNQFSIYTN